MSYSLKDALFSLSGDDDDSIDNNLAAAGRVPAVPAITQTQTDLEEYSSPVRSSSFPVATATATTTTAAAPSHRRVSSPKEPKQKLRIPIMRGTFIETTRWDEEAEETVRQHILQGTWKYNDDDTTTQNTINNKNTEQPFELIRTVPGYEENTTTPRAQGDDDDDEEDTWLSPFFMPSNGLYNGSFGLAYQHTTPKGKRSMKSTTILEENVKLEFRKLWTTAGAGAGAATVSSSTTAADATDTNFYYRIQGSGSNTIGHFSLGGTAKPCVATHQNKNNTYRIEIRRSYYGIHDPTAMSNEEKTGRTMASSSSSSSYPTYASSLLHSQKQSLMKAASKRTATATGTAPTAATVSTIAPVAEAEATATSTTTTTSITTEQPAQKDQQRQREREEKIPAVAAVAVPPSTPPVSPSSVSQYKQARLEKEEQLRKQKRLQQWRQQLLQKQQQEREREESLQQQQQQQQQHNTTHPQQPSIDFANTTSNGVDRVNGKGMWHAWTRSFDTPLLALLDLFDNAVDASWTLLPKGGDDDVDDDTADTDENTARNTKQRTTAVTKPKIRVELDTIGRNGVVMRNGSDFIPSLKQVLQVYKSQKTGDWDNSIGENGIGVKHACAALSTLSLVFTKTKSSSSSSSSSTYLSMGILMEGLQREEGIVLPSRDWKLTDSMETIKQELELICEREPFVWGKAVANYGDSNDLHDGIDKCLRHFELLRTHRDWKDCDNVFALVLTNLKHSANDADTNGLVGNVDSNDTTDDNMIIDASSTMEPAMTTRHNANHDNKDKTTAAAASSYHVVNGDGEEEEDEDKQRSVSLLNDLRNKLPYLYLHLHDLDVAVGNKPIESIFWERRLSELSKFELQISQTKLWSTVPKDFYNLGSDDPQSVFHVSNPKETIRLFCGFDPYRCQTLYPKDAEHDKEESLFTYTPGDDIGGATGGTGNNTALRVYLYSRQSGRLIKFKTDPRNELGLSAGSTDFCQGMTIIVDDHNGTLPLNPTKQDTAYGHSKYGQIHAANLKEWEAAIAHFYWHYHFSRLGGSKGAITQAVSKSKSALEDAYENYLTNYDDLAHNDDTSLLLPSLVPLCQGNFITFGQIDFALSSYRGNLKGIRAGKSARESCVPSINCNEVVVRLNEDAAAIAVGSSGKKRKQAQKTSTPSSSDKTNSGLMGFSQQQSQSQQHLQQHHQSSLENAVTTPVSTSKRLRSSQDENGDLERLFQDERQQQQQQQQHLEQQELQRLNHPSMVHINGHNSASNQAGSMVMVHRLNQFANRNRQLERQVQVQGQNIQYLQSEIEKQKAEKLADDKKIAGLTLERDKWRKYGQSKTGEAKKLLDASKRQALQIQKLQQQSGGREDVVDLTDGDTNETKKEAEEELSKLRRLVDSYKSSASFYQKENDAKKQQIENLMEEKARFEERVKHLETSQLDEVNL